MNAMTIFTAMLPEHLLLAGIVLLLILEITGARRGALALSALVVVAATVVAASLYATGPGSEFLKPEYGLFLLTAGALIGFFGIVGGAGSGDS